MKVVCALCLIIVHSNAVNGQDWSRYIPQKQRKDIIKRASRASGVGAVLRTQTLSGAIWITEIVARALISDMVDRERITKEEAESRYRAIRPENTYVIGILTRHLNAGPTIIGGSLSAKQVLDPIDKAALFIQRQDDQKNFTKGEVSDRDFDIYLEGIQAENIYIVIFPRKNREGEPVVRVVTDKIEVQYFIGPKKIVLDYKIKDLVSRLEDL